MMLARATSRIAQTRAKTKTRPPTDRWVLCPALKMMAEFAEITPIPRRRRSELAPTPSGSSSTPGTELPTFAVQNFRRFFGR
jgi:hypothetical protein